MINNTKARVSRVSETHMRIQTIIVMRIFLVGMLFTAQTSHALSCGDTVVSNIVLTEDLDCSTGYTALEVSANNVTINLNGFTVSGANTLVGISVNGYDNVTIRNGSIRGFWAGINSSRSDKLNVSKMIFYGVGEGVILTAGNDARFRNNDFIKVSGQAIKISVSIKSDSANRNQIIDNEFYRTGVGISICGEPADHNVIADNLIWKSAERGIDLIHSDRNRVYRNRIVETPDGAALRLNNSSHNTINENTLHAGGHVAMAVLGEAGRACLDGARNRSVKNSFVANQVSGFPIAILLGLGTTLARSVEGNGVLNNRIDNSTLGINFQADTRNNFARENTFTSTMTQVIDLGVNNSH